MKLYKIGNMQMWYFFKVLRFTTEFNLTHFLPMLLFYYPWKRQTTSGFLKFPGVILMPQWHEIDQINTNNLISINENRIRTRAVVGNKFHLTFIWWHSAMNTFQKNSWKKVTNMNSYKYKNLWILKFQPLLSIFKWIQ